MNYLMPINNFYSKLFTPSQGAMDEHFRMCVARLYIIPVFHYPKVLTG